MRQEIDFSIFESYQKPWGMLKLFHVQLQTHPEDIHPQDRTRLSDIFDPDSDGLEFYGWYGFESRGHPWFYHGFLKMDNYEKPLTISLGGGCLKALDCPEDLSDVVSKHQATVWIKRSSWDVGISTAAQALSSVWTSACSSSNVALKLESCSWPESQQLVTDVAWCNFQSGVPRDLLMFHSKNT